MVSIEEKTVQIPGAPSPVSLRLSPAIEALRNAALSVQKTEPRGVPTHPLTDAQTWRTRQPDEDWLVWRARRTAARLRKMPISLSSGERVVGRPDLRPPTPEETAAISSVRDILMEIPPFPGGDAGHFHPDFDKLFRLGIGGIQEEIRERMGSAPIDRQPFYQACNIAMDGLSDYARRVADACLEKASTAPDPASWTELAGICRRVATRPPETFHEAIQLMFLAIVALWFGEDHGLTTPGRMDQTLRPFYDADLTSGRLTRQQALELICCLYIQLNMILWPGSAVSVMVGGRDRNGVDVTGDLTYLCLAARMATRLVYPTAGLAWHEGAPQALSDFACKMIRTGIGDPAFFNDQLIVDGLRDHGVSDPDSYQYMNSTCVEIKVVGASNMWVTQPYFNCPLALLEVMDGVAAGDLPDPQAFDGFCTSVRHRLSETVREKAEALHRTWHQRARTGCFPLASCLIADCLERGLDFDRGGARYNWVENSFVGLANLADGLLAIRHLVYETGELTLSEFRDILKNDYEGHEGIRQRILNRIPSYGNDVDEADALAAEWAECLEDITAANTVGLHEYVPGFFCWVVHERFGSQTGATPDGRKAGFPLADGAGAAQGRDRSGPTASILSTTRWNHRKALGGLVHNVRFSNLALHADRDLAALRDLIHTYLKRGGFEIQINVVSSDVLRDARIHPEQYPDLLVRVAGYSDYFVHLNPNMQAEVIQRTENMRV